MLLPSRKPLRSTARNIPIGRLLRTSGVRSQKFARGFTLVELMVVMLIIAILAAIAIPAYVASIRAAREAVLREDLHVMRDGIDSYTNDKNRRRSRWTIW